MHNKYFTMKNYSNIFKPTKKNLIKAAKILKNSGIVALPTETVYGLAANAYSAKAIHKVYQLKKRPKKNPLIVHFDTLNSIKKETEPNLYLQKLFNKFSPGPITYVLKLKKSSRISRKLTNQSGTVACRVPANSYFRKMIKLTKTPLAAPSANVSNHVSPTSAKDVYDEFGKKIKFILDGKQSKIGLESTVINLVNKPSILRPGKISITEIKRVIKNVKKNKSKKILSPGQLKKHYSPGIPMYLNQIKPKINGAYITFGRTGLRGKNIFNLSKQGSLEEVGKKLYQKLRFIKKQGFKNISVKKIPNQGIGIAINDRLKRASS
jgi:L-threonylcarbamoyladenylate synthase